MRGKRILVLGVLLTMGLLLPAAPALANGEPPPPTGDGIVIWNENHTVEEGESVEGDLLVFNGDLTIEDGARVEGSVVVWNGNATVEGTIEGQLVVSNGDIYLGEDAIVEGDVVCTWNCEFEQEDGARIKGSIIEGTPLPAFHFEDWRAIPLAVPSPRPPRALGANVVVSWVFKAIRNIVAVIVVAAVAGLVALIWPQHMAQVGHTVAEAPLQSLGMGLLTTIAAVTLIFVLAITICLAPVSIAAAFALIAAGLFGWVCIGTLVGERLLQALKAKTIEPLWAALAGTVAVTLIAAGLDLVPCIGFLFAGLLILAVGCVGLGAVVLTRFGTSAYVPSTGGSKDEEPPAPQEPPVAPVEEPEPPKKPRRKKQQTKTAEGE